MGNPKSEIRSTKQNQKSNIKMQNGKDEARKMFYVFNKKYVRLNEHLLNLEGKWQHQLLKGIK